MEDSNENTFQTEAKSYIVYVPIGNYIFSKKKIYMEEAKSYKNWFHGNFEQET